MTLKIDNTNETGKYEAMEDKDDLKLNQTDSG